MRDIVPRGNAIYLIGAIWFIASLASVPEPLSTKYGHPDDFRNNASMKQGTKLYKSDKL